MTEKEFLESFIDFAIDKGYGSNYDQKGMVESFLTKHHEQYYEVEFVEIEDENEEHNRNYNRDIAQSIRNFERRY